MKQKGFSLIELLVVIAIIAILSGVMLVAFQGVRKSARDGRRKADLEQIRSALEIYRSDCGAYPTTAAVIFGSSLTGSCPNASTYMALLPVDPLPLSYLYRYTDIAANSSYTLCAYLETGAVVTGCLVSGNCNNGGVAALCNYCVCNP